MANSAARKKRLCKFSTRGRKRSFDMRDVGGRKRKKETE